MSHSLIPFTANPQRRGRRVSPVSSPNRAARRQRSFRPELIPVPDLEMEMVARNIDRSGLHLVHVGESCDCGVCESTPSPLAEQFGYTVGLTEVGHPELLVRGLGAEVTAELLGRWGRTVFAGAVFAPGHLLCEGPGEAAWDLLEVPEAGRELVWATRYYGRDRIGPHSALELVPTQRPCLCEGCG